MSASSSVIIAAYTMDRWSDIGACIRSILDQEEPPLEVILAVDNNPELAQRSRTEFPQIVTVLHEGTRGASSARNAGAAVARGNVLAFIDDDAVALDNWLAPLVAPLNDPSVIGTGGHIKPLWRTSRPQWFPEEFFWAVGATFRGMPTDVCPVRNVWGGNMAVRTEDFRSLGGFREDFGKVGTVARPEDTDFCIRFAAHFPGTHWLFVPASRIAHCVPGERAKVGWYLRRCMNEGRGKAELAAHVGDESGLSSERGYATSIIPKGIAREARAAVVTGDPWAGARALAMTLGLGAAGVGFADGRARQIRARQNQVADKG